MTLLQAVGRWRQGALEDLSVARDLMRLHHYDWALFMGQLALEKLLKGLVTAATDTAPPLIHDLGKLAELAKLTLTEKQSTDFGEITTFHIKARYGNIKDALYRKATKEYARKYFQLIEEYVVWLQKHY